MDKPAGLTTLTVCPNRGVVIGGGGRSPRGASRFAELAGRGRRPSVPRGMYTWLMSSRERLIDAMSGLMARQGYTATSPREVRIEAGVGQGSMYHHFAGKRDLALAALERNCAALLPATEELLAAPGNPMDKLAAYLMRPLPALQGCQVGRMTQDPAVAQDPGLLAPVAAAFDAVHQALKTVIGQAVEQGLLPGHLQANRVAFLLTSTIQGGYVLAIAAGDSRPFDEARAGALDLLHAAATTTTKYSDISGLKGTST